MSEEARRDGPYYIGEMVTVMQGIREELPGVSALPAAIQQQTAERLQHLEEILLPIRKKLFVKTQGGSEIARECYEKVEAVKELVKGLSGKSEVEAVALVEQAVKAAEERIEPFVDKTQNLVIRMT